MKPKLHLSYKARVLLLAYAIGTPTAVITSGLILGWW